MFRKIERGFSPQSPRSLKEKNITVISFKYETLEEVCKQLPHLPTQWLVSYRYKADAPKLKASIKLAG